MIYYTVYTGLKKPLNLTCGRVFPATGPGYPPPAHLSFLAFAARLLQGIEGSLFKHVASGGMESRFWGNIVDAVKGAVYKKGAQDIITARHPASKR